MATAYSQMLIIIIIEIVNVASIMLIARSTGESQVKYEYQGMILWIQMSWDAAWRPRETVQIWREVVNYAVAVRSSSREPKWCVSSESKKLHCRHYLALKAYYKAARSPVLSGDSSVPAVAYFLCLLGWRLTYNNTVSTCWGKLALNSISHCTKLSSVLDGMLRSVAAEP